MDQNHRPVASATLLGRWSGTRNGLSVTTTDAHGVAVIRSPWAGPHGEFLLRLEGVTAGDCVSSWQEVAYQIQW